MNHQTFNVQKPPIDLDSNHTILEQTSSESRVWIEFLRGSDEAVAGLYNLYANKLFNYGHQFTKNEELVLDAVQDVFLNLIRTRDKLNIATSVKFYLYASFRRTLVRQIKRSRKLVLHEDMESENFQITVDLNYLSVNTTYNSDEKKIIEHFCNKLPSRQREAIVLHYFEDLNYSEIAKTMNFLNSKSARTLVYRALDSLSKLLSTWKKELIVILSALSFHL